MFELNSPWDPTVSRPPTTGPMPGIPGSQNAQPRPANPILQTPGERQQVNVNVQRPDIGGAPAVFNQPAKTGPMPGMPGSQTGTNTGQQPVQGAPQAADTYENPFGHENVPEITKNPDGTTTIYDPATGQTTTYNPDGSVQPPPPPRTDPEYEPLPDTDPSANPDGYEDDDPGEDQSTPWRTKENGDRVRRNRNGEIERRTEDGTVYRRLADGTVLRRNPDGSVVRRNPDGSIVRREASEGADPPIEPGDTGDNPFNYGPDGTPVNFLTPWTQRFAPPTDPGHTDVEYDPTDAEKALDDIEPYERHEYDELPGYKEHEYGTLPGYNKFGYDDLPEYKKAGAAPEFVPPTYEELAADPAYQERLRSGVEALDHSAAAKGLARSGGTYTDILGFGQRLASEELENIYNRRVGQHQLATETYKENRGEGRFAFQQAADRALEMGNREAAEHHMEFQAEYDAAVRSGDREAQQHILQQQREYERAVLSGDREAQQRILEYQSRADIGTARFNLAERSAQQEFFGDQWNEQGRQSSYDRDYDRRFGEYIADRDTFFRNRDNQYQVVRDLTDLGVATI